MQRLVVAVGVGLLAASSAAGFGGRQQQVLVYSYPAPTYWLPVAVPVYPVQRAPAWVACPPAGVVPLTPRARPTPAPPSATPALPSTPPSTSAPPLAPTTPSVPKLPADKPSAPTPGVSESRAYFDVYPVAPGGADKPAGDRCSVGFWNVTGGDLTLKVDGQAHTLARGKSLTLELGRHFTWQVENRDVQTERLAADKVGLEIVIRQ